MGNPRNPRQQKRNNFDDSADLGELLEEEFEDDIEVESRTVFLVGDVEERRITKAIKSIISLAEASHADDPIYLYISTFGGYVYEAMALYDVMQFVPCPIHTLSFGKVMSAGCLLAAGGEPGHRYIAPNAMLLYHAGTDDATGNVWEVETRLAEFKRCQAQYDRLFADHCGRSVAEVETLYAKERVDNYMTADQALAFGVVDHILPARRHKRGPTPT